MKDLNTTIIAIWFSTVKSLFIKGLLIIFFVKILIVEVLFSYCKASNSNQLYRFRGIN